MTSVLTTRRHLDPTLALALGAAAVMALAQIAIPLTSERAGLTVLVVATFAVVTTALTARTWGWSRAVIALVTIAALTAAIERVGTATGWPFGAYQYGEALQPQLDGVPLVVPLAWFAMAVPAREVAARLVATRWGQVLLGAAMLTAWDIMLDPQMVAEGYWTWEADGVWRGIPLSNYLGWLLSGTVVMGVLALVLPRPGRSRPLLAVYTWWGVMSSLGFLAFFGDPVVGLVGGLAMLPVTALAWRAELTGSPRPARPRRG